MGPLKRANFNNWIRELGPFPSSDEGRETPTLLGPLQRANFNNWIRKLGLFPSSDKRREAPTLLGPLERANLNPSFSHWGGLYLREPRE
jgi:hypothetical protein